MANEITIQASINAVKGGAQINRNGSKSITMAGDDLLSATQVIGTTAELIDFGEISGAPAAFWVKNLDATNFVSLSMVSTGATPFVKLLAGQVNLLSPASATIYAIADTTPSRIEIAAAEA